MKLWIRQLGEHMHAQRQQMRAFHRHLHDQYRDRLSYWSARGISRSHGHEITCILDGMDQAKFMYPRGSCLKSALAGDVEKFWCSSTILQAYNKWALAFWGKEFQRFLRPRAHVAGALIHGFGVYFIVSEPDLPKDASTQIEIVANLLTRLESQGVRLKETKFTLQCDNTPRECKNNIMLSFLASLVSRGNQAARLNCFPSCLEHSPYYFPEVSWCQSFDPSAHDQEFWRRHLYHHSGLVIHMKMLTKFSGD